MDLPSTSPLNAISPRRPLRVYMLGIQEFEATLALQHRLVEEVATDQQPPALLLCEHLPLVTIGRQGSWSHVHCSREELQERRWSVRWVNRGGGCQLPLPGQLALYSILPLDRLGLTLAAYVDKLHAVFRDLLDDFRIRVTNRPGSPDLWVGPRVIATIGVAVQDWVSYYGAAFNINPDLVAYRQFQVGGPDGGRMTSLERERHGPLRPSLVRERLLEHYVRRFGFSHTSLFFEHAALTRKAASNALPTAS